MRIWNGTPHDIEVTPAWEGASLRSWRWALEVHFTSIELFEEYSRDGGITWSLANRYYTLCITKRWAMGEYHLYYDGPHCSFSLGFLHYNWSGEWCTECMPNETITMKTEEKTQHKNTLCDKCKRWHVAPPCCTGSCGKKPGENCLCWTND